MRAVLLIALMMTAVAGAAQAQTSPYRNPYSTGPAKDPYDLPKPLQGNPYDRDYSKQDTYKNQQDYQNRYGGSANRGDSNTGGLGYGYGSQSQRSNDSGVNSSRNRRDCKPGVVC